MKYDVELAKPMDIIIKSDAGEMPTTVFSGINIQEERKRWQDKIDKLNTNLILKTTELVEKKKLLKQTADELKNMIELQIEDCRQLCNNHSVCESSNFERIACGRAERIIEMRTLVKKLRNTK